MRCCPRGAAGLNFRLGLMSAASMFLGLVVLGFVGRIGLWWRFGPAAKDAPGPASQLSDLTLRGRVAGRPDPGPRRSQRKAPAVTLLIRDFEEWENRLGETLDAYASDLPDADVVIAGGTRLPYPPIKVRTALMAKA